MTELLQVIHVETNNAHLFENLFIENAYITHRQRLFRIQLKT